MKLAITTASLLMLAVASMAQMGHGVSKTAKHIITCPVSGDKLDMDKATKSKMYADYKGNRYFFCCNDCPSTFKKNPAKYAAKPHIKTPKPTK
ncbi:MAG: YHS domain-containing protein [Armatimonadetes bacterium]|nr:YHS domain-containing protein [Armatimonadota bacterium]